MAEIVDVAKYILERMGRMSTWKLQKLCYYAQAWTLAWGDAPLFDEDFQAWSNGPVCPELFHCHQGMFMIDADAMKRGDSSNLSPDQKENIDVIIRDYGQKEPYELRELSHMESPWRDARGGLPDGEPCRTVITKEAMGEYYGSL